MWNRRFHNFWPTVSAVAALAVCTAACSYLLLVTSGGGLPHGTALHSAPPRATASPAESTVISAALPFSARVMDRTLVLVSPTSKLPDWYKPNLVTAFGIEMDASTAAAYASMHAAAAKDGISLWVSSGYRSDERQGELFEREVAEYRKTYGTLSAAETFAARSVAKPGYSEHATGLALDLNGVLDDFDKTAAFRWLDQHAQEYGFILRYPKDKQDVTHIKYEPWHYRYVGEKNAVAMKISGQCLEEYLQSVQKTTAVN